MPILVILLQLSTQLFYVTEPPLKRLYKGNLTFFRGIPVFYKIATAAFPYTLIGHFSEIIDYGFYMGNIFQVPHSALVTAVQTLATKEDVYHSLVASRSHHESEHGGLLAISYFDNSAIHLYEIPSLNGIYSARLHQAVGSFPKLLEMMTSEEGREVFDKVGIEKKIMEETISLLKNDRLPDPVKKTIVDNFVELYDTLSESRYLLSPLQFKEGIGRISFGERYVGTYHFHNGIEEPPSEIDVEQSLRKRQIVMTLTAEGWALYDVAKRDLKRINIGVDNKVRLE